MNEILVPLDGSEHAELALPWAGELAGALNASIRLVAIHPADEQMWAAAHIDMAAELSHRRAWLEEYLERAAVKVSPYAQSVRRDVLEGDVSLRLTNAMDASDVVFVVIATSGTAGFQGVPSTSITDRLVRAKRKPVVVVPPHASPEDWDGVVVPLDGSAAGERALPFARELATKANWPIHLIHVVDANPGWALPDDVHQRLAASLREWGESYLRSVTQPNETIAVVEGPVIDAVFEYAAENDCSYVVLATHGRSGPDRLEIGSVADSIVRAADRPTILVPATG